MLKKGTTRLLQQRDDDIISVGSCGGKTAA